MTDGDQVSPGRRAIGALLDGAATLALLVGAVAVTTRVLGWTGHAVVALLQAALPLTLVPVWPAAVVCAVRRMPVRFAAALVLIVLHVLAVAPALGRDARPDWAAQGTASRLMTANVFKDSQDPGLAGVLLAAHADVYVLVELTSARERQLDAAGVFAGHPYRTDGGGSTYGRVVVVSRYPLRDVVEARAGDVSTPVVTVDLGATTVRLIGAHPRAPTDRCCADQQAWMRWAREQGRSSAGPLIIGGDVNASRWVPAMGELLAAGMVDAHEAVGRGLSASWPAGGDYVDRPFMRLDHVLYRGRVAAVAVRDVRLPGSDHRGIVADLLVG